MAYATTLEIQDTLRLDMVFFPLFKDVSDQPLEEAFKNMPRFLIKLVFHGY